MEAIDEKDAATLMIEQAKATQQQDQKESKSKQRKFQKKENLKKQQNSPGACHKPQTAPIIQEAFQGEYFSTTSK